MGRVWDAHGMRMKQALESLKTCFQEHSRQTGVNMAQISLERLVYPESSWYTCARKHPVWLSRADVSARAFNERLRWPGTDRPLFETIPSSFSTAFPRYWVAPRTSGAVWGSDA